MAASKLDPKLLTVGIIGYTGECGKALTTEVLKNSIFKNVVLIGRRKVDYKEDFYNAATQKVIDFEKMNDSEDAFKQLDVLYCCLGTTRAKSGAEGFRHVDYDYVYNAAEIAKKTGCKQFHLISSAGADKNSFLLYPKTKGEIEEAVTKMNFDYCAIYRPKFLICEREERRIAEKIALVFVKPFQYMAPTLLTTPTEILAKAMVNNTINLNSSVKSEIIDNTKIFDLSKN